jgi:hypothetical protein
MPKTSKKKTPALSRESALEIVRRLMRSSGFDEEEVYGGGENQVHFASREEGDVLEGRADPGLVRLAREKAKEIEAAVPGAKARAEVVDEWVSIDVTLPSAKSRALKPLKVGDAVEIPGGPDSTLVGTIKRIFNDGTPAESAEVHAQGYLPSFHPTRTLKKARRRPLPAAAPAPAPSTPTLPTRQRYLKPGDEVAYTNFTVGGSYEGKAIATWDHGKSVEARTLGGEKIRLERASDGSLRRFT